MPLDLVIRRTLFASLSLTLPESQIFFVSRDDAGFDAGSIEIRFTEIGGHPLWTVKEDQKYIETPLAAEMEDFSVDGLLGPGMPNR